LELYSNEHIAHFLFFRIRFISVTVLTSSSRNFRRRILRGFSQRELYVSIYYRLVYDSKGFRRLCRDRVTKSTENHFTVFVQLVKRYLRLGHDHLWTLPFENVWGKKSAVPINNALNCLFYSLNVFVTFRYRNNIVRQCVYRWRIDNRPDWADWLRVYQAEIERRARTCCEKTATRFSCFRLGTQRSGQFQIAIAWG